VSISLFFSKKYKFTEIVATVTGKIPCETGQAFIKKGTMKSPSGLLPLRSVVIIRRSISTLQQDQANLSSTATTAATTTTTLTWPNFFKHRYRLKYYSFAGGIIGMCAFLCGEGVLLSQPLFDPTMTIFGMDPLIALGLGTLTGSFCSYSLSAALTKSIWRMINASLARQMDSVMPPTLPSLFASISCSIP
jgi:Mitochondrial import protein Pam17